MKWREAALFGVLFLAPACFQQPWEYDNTKVRYLLLSAVVDDGTLNIDRQQQYTMDKAFAGGHYYANKSIGAPLVAVPFYWILRHFFLRPLADLPDRTILADPVALYLVRLWTATLPFACLGLVLWRFLRRAGATDRAALRSVLAYSFCSIAVNHASLLSGAETAAALLFLSFHLLTDPEPSAWTPLAAGAAAGVGALCDFTAILPAAVLAAYALAAPSRLPAKARFILGAAPWALLFAAYNRACFGSVWSVSWAHVPPGPLTAVSSGGLFGLAWPDPRRLALLLFSPARGLFFIMPFFLFSIPGFAAMARSPRLRRPVWACAGIATAGLLFNASYAGWHAGWTFGPRYLVPILPFLAVPLAFAPEGGPWFAALAGLSALQAACAEVGVPHAAQEILNPLVEFILPLMREGAALPYRPQAPAWAAAALGLSIWAAFLGAAVWLLRGLPRGGERKLPARQQMLAAGVFCAVAFGLCFVRTPDRRAVHRYRGIVLADAAWSLRAPELARRAEAELRLGGGAAPTTR